VLGKEAFPLGHGVVVKDKGYMLQYSLEQEDFEADDDFVPKAWCRNGDPKDRNHDRKYENDGNGSSKRAKNEF
jgi:hypothetical protein